ncbi:MAG: thiamine pyrophosphate-binding protein [Halanaeroarchaeum sp.]
MTVAAAVIDALQANDVRTIFGIPGKQTLPLNRAVDATDDVRFVMARNETAVSHQAWGYAESSGKVAATLVIPGPGDLHAANGLKNALNDNTPLVHLAVETEPAIRGGDGIHETPPETYDTVVKANVTVETPESTVAELQRAIDLARTHPKGPVRVGIPKNFLKMDVPVARPDPGKVPTPPAPSQADLADALDLLAAADRPVIVAGGGVRASGAEASLRTLAERLDAPVVTSYKGKGTFPETHDRSAGVAWSGASPALRDLLAEADLALGIGTDFDAVWTANWSLPMPETLIHVTMDPADLGTGYDPTVGIVADADATIQAFLDSLEQATTDGATRAAAVRDDERARLDLLREDDDPPLTSVAALTAVSETLPEDAIVTADAGGSRIWTLVTHATERPRHYVNVGSWASMSTSLPSAVGASVANPDVPVVALAGEGGFLMTVHELQTLAAEDLDVTAVVFNNNDYAIISEEAERSYGVDRGAFELDEETMDVVAVAEGMGVPARRATTPAEIRSELAALLDREGPALLEVPTDPHEPQASEWMTADEPTR